MKKNLVLFGLIIVLLLTACGGGEAEVADGSTAAEPTATATATAVSVTAPTVEPTAVPTTVPTAVPPTAVPPTAVPTIPATLVPTAESVDMASCLIGTWDYANLEEAMEGLITEAMPPELVDGVGITGVNGRLFITFGEDGIASGGSENLVVGMSMLGTEAQTAVVATGATAYTVDGNTIFTDLVDYDSTGTELSTGQTVTFDIGMMLAAGETGEAVSTFNCEGDLLEISNDNLPVSLQLQRVN